MRVARAHQRKKPAFSQKLPWILCMFFNRYRKHAIAAFFLLIGLGFALYVYRFQIYIFNFNLLRGITIVLVIIFVFKNLNYKKIPKNLYAFLVLILLILILNIKEYLRLEEYPFLQKEIGAHVFNLVMMVSLISIIDDDYNLKLAIKGYVYASLVAFFIAYYAYFLGDIPFENFLMVHGPTENLLKIHGPAAMQKFKYQPIVDGGAIRLSGPFFDPNFFGVYLLSVFIFSSWLYRYAEKNCFYIFLSLLSIFTLFLTRSRTAFAGLIVFSCLYLFLESKKKIRHFICLAAVLGSFFFVAATTNILSKYWVNLETVKARLPFLERGLDAFMSNPLTGSSTLSLLGPNSGTATAHMVYLTLLAKYGIVGAGIYLIFIFWPIFYAFLNRKKCCEAYMHLIYSLILPLSVIYLSYDFFTFLEFQYFIFAVCYALVISVISKRWVE